MRKPRIGVIVHTHIRDALFSIEDRARLDMLGRVVWTESRDPISVAEAVKILHDCQIGIGSWGTPRPDAQLLPACPELKLWVHAAGSVKGMFGQHLDGRDLTIASCAPAIAECVAQMVVGELIVGLKRVLPNAAANRLGKAPRPHDAKNLSSATIGVIAASEVGKHVIRLLKPFDCQVLLYDPFVNEEKAREMGVKLMKTVVELCSAADAVTLHTPALPSTKNIIALRELQTMRDDAVFINTSRGDCVDEAALCAELGKGRLFAFLDVSAPEPAEPDSPLRKLPNVVYTSHIAGGPDFKIGRQAVDDIEAFLRGQRPRMAPTRDMLDRIA